MKTFPTLLSFLFFYCNFFGHDKVFWHEIPTSSSHKKEVSSFSIDINKHVFASSSMDGTVKLWSIRTGKLINRPLLHNDGVFSVVFCDSGTELLTASKDKTVKVWDSLSGKQIGNTMEHGDEVTGAFFINKHRIVSFANNNKICLWERKKDKFILEKSIKLKEPIWGGGISPKGTYIFFRGRKSCFVFSYPQLKMLNEINHQENINDCLFDFQEKVFVAGGLDRVSICDLSHPNKPIERINQSGVIYSCAINFNGTILVTNGKRGASILDLVTGKKKGNIKGNKEGIACQFFPNSNDIVLTFGNILQIWDLNTMEKKCRDFFHPDEIWTINIAKDGNTILSGSIDGMIKIITKKPKA